MYGSYSHNFSCDNVAAVVAVNLGKAAPLPVESCRDLHQAEDYCVMILSRKPRLRHPRLRHTSDLPRCLIYLNARGFTCRASLERQFFRMVPNCRISPIVLTAFAIAKHAAVDLRDFVQHELTVHNYGTYTWLSKDLGNRTRGGPKTRAV